MHAKYVVPEEIEVFSRQLNTLAKFEFTDADIDFSNRQPPSLLAYYKLRRLLHLPHGFSTELIGEIESTIKFWEDMPRHYSHCVVQIDNDTDFTEMGIVRLLFATLGTRFCKAHVITIQVDETATGDILLKIPYFMGVALSYSCAKVVRLDLPWEMNDVDYTSYLIVLNLFSAEFVITKYEKRQDAVFDEVVARLLKIRNVQGLVYKNNEWKNKNDKNILESVCGDNSEFYGQLLDRIDQAASVEELEKIFQQLTFSIHHNDIHEARCWYFHRIRISLIAKLCSLGVENVAGYFNYYLISIVNVVALGLPLFNFTNEEFFNRKIICEEFSVILRALLSSGEKISHYMKFLDLIVNAHVNQMLPYGTAWEGMLVSRLAAEMQEQPDRHLECLVDIRNFAELGSFGQFAEVLFDSVISRNDPATVNDLAIFMSAQKVSKMHVQYFFFLISMVQNKEQGCCEKLLDLCQDLIYVEQHKIISDLIGVAMQPRNPTDSEDDYFSLAALAGILHQVFNIGDKDLHHLASHELESYQSHLQGYLQRYQAEIPPRHLKVLQEEVYLRNNNFHY